MPLPAVLPPPQSYVKAKRQEAAAANSRAVISTTAPTGVGISLSGGGNRAYSCA